MRGLLRRLDRLADGACPKCGTEQTVIRVVAPGDPPAEAPTPCQVCGREASVVRVTNPFGKTSFAREIAVTSDVGPTSFDR